MKNIKNKENTSLYWYGFWAQGKKYLGKAIIILGIALGIYLTFALNYQYGLASIVIGIILGTYLIIKGRAQYFDFEIQSGRVLYHGGEEGEGIGE